MLSIKDFLAKRKSARAQTDTGAETTAPVVEPTEITIIAETDTERVILIPSFVIEDEFSEYF